MREATKSVAGRRVARSLWTVGRAALPNLLLFGCLLVRHAAAERLPIKSYTTVEGLASDRINCILRDSHGFLWFGTWDGISRFDGYGFENLTEDLPGPSVNALLESRDGTYWAATIGGLAHWDPARKAASGSVEIRFIPGGAHSGLHTLLEDRQGVLWVGGETGLFRVASRERWAPESVAFDPRGAETPPVYALLEDHAGTLWIGAESGLYRREAGGSFTRIRVSDGSPLAVRCLLEDREGTIWAGTHFNGIFRVAREEKTKEPMARPFSSVAGGLAGNHVVSLFQSFDGMLWAGCYGGLSEFAPGSSRPRTYTSAEGLPALGVFAIAEDRAENLWIGTDNAGVARLARGGFRSYEARDGLTSNRVVSLFKNREGEACISSAGMRSEILSDTGRLLECFDGFRFHAVKPRIPATTHLGWGWSQVSFQDSRGEWWIPTFEGLYRFPAVPFARLGTTPPRVYTTSDGLPSDKIFRVYEDRSGDIWMSLSTSEKRLARWSRSSETIQAFSPVEGQPIDSPISFAQDHAGALWAGFYEGGVVRMLDGRFTFLTEKDGIPAGRIRTLHVDRAGRLWIGSSRGGVGRIDQPGELPPRVRTYTTRERLSSNNIWSFAEDRWGRIYIGAERGLDRLDPSTGIVQTFTTDDGLVRGVIEESLEDGRGDLWFGSAEGLARLIPEPPRRRTAPPVRVARVLIGGARQSWPDLGTVHVRMPDLSWGIGPVQLDFFGLDFSVGGRLHYQYRLDGADSKWGPLVEERSVVFANLRPGNYRFRVRAVGNDGSVSPEPADVAFRILPPYWQRPWFLALGAAALMALAYLIHRNRLREALALERVRTRIATDLHDDIGSSLSQIAILSEIAQQQPDEEISRVRAMLARIASVSRDVVDSLGDTIWAIDPKRDRLQDLVHRMRRFSGDLLTERNIELAFDAPIDHASLDLASDLRRQIFLIFKEAVNNMARHSGCTRAEIEFRLVGGSLQLRMSDNGRGFDATKPENGYGMTSMRGRVADLHGTVEVISETESPQGAPGTTISVSIPLRK